MLPVSDLFLPALLLLVPLWITSPGKASRSANQNTADTFVEEQLKRGKKPNALIEEKSPYLLQHAFNPVDWLPWGEEAFARAERENKPVFLSIGYSTCHWCHVMAHESFEDEKVARYLNDYFICIKVDREERADIDQIYMTATLAITGSGGWPMSVFLLADRTPFYAGTYFPPRSVHGLPGFLDLLKSITALWHTDPGKISQSARAMGEHLHKLARSRGQGKVADNVFDRAYDETARSFDQRYGGFGPPPKFPRPVIFDFLSRYHRRKGEEKALEMTLTTLKAMARGGMYDILGGGFHRYSVDGQWRIPHFEKMLYDQGQLVVSYLDAFLISGDPFFRRIAEETLDYVGRDMTDVLGGFYSAEDADSPEPDDPSAHSEGAFYTWRFTEINEALGQEAPLFSFHYGVEEGGNALADPQGEFTGKNIFYQARGIEETASRFGKSEKETREVLAAARRKLFELRASRPRPHLDDKVICAWNGLMISAFARGYQVTKNPAYLERARDAAAFVMDTLYDEEEGMLLRRYRQGEAGLAGQLDDYVFFVQGLLDLYEASLEINWLERGLALTRRQLDLFEDVELGGFFETGESDRTLLVRMKGDYDGAEPAANSVAAANLIRLAPLADSDWREKAAATIDCFADQINANPTAMPRLLAALDSLQDPPRQIVIAGDPAGEDTRDLIRAVQSRYLPDTLLLLADKGQARRFLSERMEIIGELVPRDGRACAYVCENYACRLPITDPAELDRNLDG